MGKISCTNQAECIGLVYCVEKAIVIMGGFFIVHILNFFQSKIISNVETQYGNYVNTFLFSQSGILLTFSQVKRLT